MKNFYLSFNKPVYLGVGICCLFFSFSAFAEKPTNEKDITQLSEALGCIIGKSLASLGIDLDIEAIVRGVNEGAEGKEGLLSEKECMDAISHLQQESLALAAEANLKIANSFLEENQLKAGIVSVIEGKLQYQISKAGDGKIVEIYSKPLIRYSGKYLDGTPIASIEELVDLDETILGFKNGLIGMKEGEIRTLFIHPDLGYGSQVNSAPNSLLIFEVEVVKADTSADGKSVKLELPDTLDLDRILR